MTGPDDDLIMGNRSGEARETVSLSLPVEIHGLDNQFGNHVVHNGLELTLERNQVLGVVGGSGAGKTVLLNSILGLHQPTAGTIRIFGQDMGRASGSVRRQIMSQWGVLFQSGALFSALSVLENVMAPIREFTRLANQKRAMSRF